MDNNNTQPNTPLDSELQTFTKALAMQEGGGKLLSYTNPSEDEPNAPQGTAGGRYQFTANTWKAYAGEVLKDPNAPMTPENQNKVTYTKLKQWKDEGKTYAQMASMWNAGENAPNSWKPGTVQKHGDTPTYVKNVQKYAQQLSQNTTPQGNGYVQPPAPTTSPDTTNGNTDTTNAPDTYGATFPATLENQGNDTFGVKAGLKAIGNVPSSLFNLAGGLFSAVTHPIKTVEGIGNAFAGGIEEGWNKLTGGSTNNQQTQTFDALKKALYDRYGTLENAQRSATNDPVGVGTDILSILEGGASLADKALGTTGTDIARTTAESNLKNFSETGINTMPKVGEGKVSGLLNDTLEGVAKPVVSGLKSTITAPAKLAGQTLGLQTGVGVDAIKQGLQASSEGGDAMKAFTQALRGNASPEELVNQARTALGDVVNTRNTEYQKMLSTIKADSTTFDISPVIRQVEQKLKDFGITKNADGTLNFSRSAIGEGADATKIESIYNDVKNWGSQAGDRTATGIDTLKRRIGNYYSPNSDIRAFTTSVKQSVKGILENAPGYTTAMKNYAEMSDNITEIQKALSLGDNASVETSFKKLTSALKNNEFRKSVIQGLDADTGGQLLNKIAGQRLSSVMPRGLAGVFEGGLTGATAVLHPGGLLPLLGLTITTSPRIVGEFVRALGLGIQGTNKLMSLLNKFSTPIVAGGEISNRTNPGVINQPMSKEELQSKIPGLFGGNVNQ